MSAELDYDNAKAMAELQELRDYIAQLFPEGTWLGDAARCDVTELSGDDAHALAMAKEGYLYAVEEAADNLEALVDAVRRTRPEQWRKLWARLKKREERAQELNELLGDIEKLEGKQQR